MNNKKEEWKIYTKKGDKGETSLIGGTRVPKYDDRIEAYGTLDELNSFIGYLRDQLIDQHTKSVLLKVQESLFVAESILATDMDKMINKTLPLLKPSDIELLEREIDRIEEELPPLENFILPTGHPLVSLAHICRTICRRAERITVKLSNSQKVDDLVLKLLNRLSDYMFVLSRKIAANREIADVLWQPETGK